MTIIREIWVNPAEGEIIADFGSDMVAIKWTSGYFGIYAIDRDAEGDKTAMQVSQCLYKPAAGRTYADEARAVYFR